jgi:predicted site-specific integrase-resolvase
MNTDERAAMVEDLFAPTIEKLFTPRSVAQALSLDLYTLYGQIRRGEVKAIRLNGKRTLRISESEVRRITRGV